MLVQPVRVGETTTTTGTGTYTLAGAIDSGYATFLTRFGAVTVRVHYACYSTAGYEVGVGEFNGSNQLSRSQIIYSSNSNNAVSWSAGTKTIIALWPGGIPFFSSVASLAAADIRQLVGAEINYSGAADATYALPALAACPEGFYFLVRNNSATGDVTLDPDASEQIETGASYIVYRGQHVIVMRRSASWRIAVLPQRKQVVAGWGSFSSTGGAPSIRDSYRITSITRNSAGSYAVAFSAPRPDANYLVVATAQNVGGTGNVICGFSGKTTTGFSLGVTEANGATPIDPGQVDFIVMDKAA